MKNPSFVFNSDNELIDVCLTLKDVEKYKNKDFIITKDINYNNRVEVKVEKWKPKKIHSSHSHLIDCEADEIELKNRLVKIPTKKESDIIHKKEVEEKRRKRELDAYNYYLERVLIKHHSYFKHDRLIDGDFYVGNVVGHDNIKEEDIIVCLWNKKDDCFIQLWFDGEKPYFNRHKHIDDVNYKYRFVPLRLIASYHIDYIVNRSIITPIKECELNSGWYIVKSIIGILAYYNSFDKSFYIFFREKESNRFSVYKKKYTSNFEIEKRGNGRWHKYNTIVDKDSALPVCSINDIFKKI
ncbi:MAG: hypothetical protein QXO70_04005 [Candidatus Pacearchaeota archaeon]